MKRSKKKRNEMKRRSYQQAKQNIYRYSEIFCTMFNFFSSNNRKIKKQNKNKKKSVQSARERKRIKERRCVLSWRRNKQSKKKNKRNTKYKSIAARQRMRYLCLIPNAHPHIFDTFPENCTLFQRKVLENRNLRINRWMLQREIIKILNMCKIPKMEC